MAQNVLAQILNCGVAAGLKTEDVNQEIDHLILKPQTRWMMVIESPQSILNAI